MSDNLIRGLLLVGFFLIIMVTAVLKKGKIPMKFALAWYIPAFGIVLLALVPNIFVFIANILGFQTISNLVIGMLFVILFLIIIALTIIIASQTNKINSLIQEVSILNKKVNDNGK